MFWRKKSPSKKNYLTFYLESDNLKVEFSFEDVSEIITLTDAVVNGKVRHACIETIYKKIFDGGLHAEANEFLKCVNKTILPSEYQT